MTRAERAELSFLLASCSPSSVSSVLPCQASLCHLPAACRAELSQVRRGQEQHQVSSPCSDAHLVLSASV